MRSATPDPSESRKSHAALWLVRELKFSLDGTIPIEEEGLEEGLEEELGLAFSWATSTMMMVVVVLSDPFG